MLLSDMGAEVIKVEQPGLGDYMRATPPTKDGGSPVHATVNRSKFSIGIDLKAEEGKGVLRRLLKETDVFVEGFRPGVMKRLGFPFEAVRRINPKIVYCAISAYGQSSRLSSMPGHDINFQAMAGTLGYSRRAEVPLLQLSDMVSGIYAALAIAGALVERKGAVFIDVPIVPSLLSWMVLPASTYLATGRPPKEGDSLIFGSTPYYNLYRTSDGRYIAVAAIEQEFWHNLTEAVGARELEQKRFGTIKERREVTSGLRRIFASRTRDEWASLLMDKDTCATPVLSVEEASDQRLGKRCIDAGRGRRGRNGAQQPSPLETQNALGSLHGRAVLGQGHQLADGFDGLQQEGCGKTQESGSGRISRFRSGTMWQGYATAGRSSLRKPR